MKSSRIRLTFGLVTSMSSMFAPLTFAQNAAPYLTTPIAASAPTAVPALVPYSGMVVAGDKGLAKESGVTFQIYKQEAGGEALWTETQTIAIDASGRYKVQLGAASPSGLPVELFGSGEARWLEVEVAGQAPQGRVLLESVPYALKAADAATLGGFPASAFLLAGGKATIGTPATVSPDAGSTVTTAGGTANKLAKFNGSSTIVNSTIYDNGTEVGVGTIAPTATLSVGGSLAVTGVSTYNNSLTLSAASTANSTHSYTSPAIKMFSSVYNSSSKAAVSPRFEWQVEPTGNNTASPNGTLNLLASSGANTTAETGLYLKSDGTIHFATGQTFPGGSGSGTITGVKAGTALTGGGTSGTVTLNVDTTKVALLTAANTFAASQGITGGDLSLGSTFDATSGVINIGGVPFLHGFAKGKRNVFVGGAGNFTTTGSATAAMGSGALAALTSGSNNTAAGSGALAGVTSGSSNTGVGLSAGPTGGTLSNTTAVGANARVGQSNSLALGQNNSGSPGASHVNVGIGTAKPISALEIAVSNTSGLGPALTLTNPGGNINFSSGADAIDFNTQAVSTAGTYNPGARMQVVDDGLHTSDISFLSNIWGEGAGAPNNGLQTNMTIYGLRGSVSIGTTATSSQLEVVGVSGNEGTWTFGGNEPDEDMLQGLIGLRAGGGYSTGTNTGGIGEWLFGGDSDGTGPTGEGLLVWTGQTNTGTIGLAADFEGDVYVNGTLSANVKNFKVDHPLDPANKYLVHASVESSEMMNIYSGNVTTDELGLATVRLPDWFQAENTDFRYQLTVIDERFAQAVVSKRVADNQFTIHTNASQVQVSWQITAVRQDAYAKAHPMVVEQQKGEKERGFYQHPELYGQPKEKQTQWGVHPQMVRQWAAEKSKIKATVANRANKVNGTSQPRSSSAPVQSAELK